MISVSEPVDDSPAGSLFEGILECAGEFCSRNLGAEVVPGLGEAVNRRRRPGGTAPYGYRYAIAEGDGQPRKVLEVDPERAAPAREIFKPPQATTELGPSRACQTGDHRRRVGAGTRARAEYTSC